MSIMSSRLEVIRAKEAIANTPRRTIEPKEMVELLGPWMSPPTELSENELRLVMAMITFEPCERSIDGLLKLGLRQKFMVEISECAEDRLEDFLKKRVTITRPKSGPSGQPSRSRSHTKSKRKGKASKTKGSSPAAASVEPKFPELPTSLSIDYGAEEITDRSAAEMNANKELPPVRFSPAFISYIRKPEGKKRLKQIAESVWTASTAFWDHGKAEEQRGATIKVQEARTVSESLDSISAAARRTGTQAGIKAGVEAALLAHQMSAAPVDGGNKWDVKPVVHWNLDDESQLRGKVASIRAGSSLARTCSSLIVPLPEDAGPVLTMHRKKLLFEFSVRDAKLHFNALFAEAKAYGASNAATESKPNNTQTTSTQPGGPSGSQTSSRRSGVSESRFAFARETFGQKGQDIERTASGGWAFDAAQKQASTKTEGQSTSEQKAARKSEVVYSEDRQRTPSNSSTTTTGARATDPSKNRVLEVPRQPSRSSSRPSSQSRRSDSSGSSGSESGKARVLVVPPRSGSSSGGEQSSSQGQMVGRVVEVSRPRRQVSFEGDTRARGGTASGSGSGSGTGSGSRVRYPDSSGFGPVVMESRGGGLRELLDMDRSRR